jgi:hypothetical protein
MSEEFDPAWEYWTPNDPEVAEILGRVATGYDAFGSEFRTEDDRGRASGIRFGRGNPDNFNGRLAPVKRSVDDKELPPLTMCRGCAHLFRPNRPGQQFCDRTCLPAAAEPVVRVCGLCRIEYLTKRPGQVYCCAVCSGVAAGQGRMTVDREVLDALLSDGLTVKEAAKTLGVPYITCYTILYRRGVRTPRKTLSVRTCPTCGVEYRPTRLVQVVCSMRCRKLPGKARTLPEMGVCISCENEFRPARSRQWFCSRVCAGRAGVAARKYPVRESSMTLEQAKAKIRSGSRFGDVFPDVAEVDREELKRWFVYDHHWQPAEVLQAEVVKQARHMGYTGDVCQRCQACQMVRVGACLRCEKCGETTGC